MGSTPASGKPEMVMADTEVIDSSDYGCEVVVCIVISFIILLCLCETLSKTSFVLRSECDQLLFYFRECIFLVKNGACSSD
ncbi:hypothetical protein R5R35_007262 [Gryllus longicercus]|uniref:Uncharacterized protein n=1 Tax=Gryllus longicercus TaxID=2509291 RepID=A0AAN9VYH1_9ORTH